MKKTSRFNVKSLAWRCASAAVDAVFWIDPTQPSDIVLAAVYDALVQNDPKAGEPSKKRKP